MFNQSLNKKDFFNFCCFNCLETIRYSSFIKKSILIKFDKFTFEENIIGLQNTVAIRRNIYLLNKIKIKEIIPYIKKELKILEDQTILEVVEFFAFQPLIKVDKNLKSFNFFQKFYQDIKENEMILAFDKDKGTDFLKSLPGDKMAIVNNYKKDIVHLSFLTFYFSLLEFYGEI